MLPIPSEASKPPSATPSITAIEESLLVRQCEKRVDGIQICSTAAMCRSEAGRHPGRFRFIVAPAEATLQPIYGSELGMVLLLAALAFEQRGSLYSRRERPKLLLLLCASIFVLIMARTLATFDDQRPP